MSSDFIIGCVIFSILPCIFTWAITGSTVERLTRRRMEREAIAHNCGKYVADTDGDFVFRWRDEQ